MEIISKINNKRQIMSDNSFLNQIINNDELSDIKNDMKNGENYWKGKHDILKVNFRQYKDAHGNIRQNNARSNYKISHAFHKLLVTQKVGFIAGNPIVVSTKDEEFQQYLNKFLKFDFDDIMCQWLTESSNKGVGFLHFFYDGSVTKDGKPKLKFAIIPAEQIIPIYDNEFQREIVELIRYYTFTALDKNGEKVTRHKVEWWTSKDVTYYIEDTEEKDVYKLDQNYKINPAPHWLTYNTNRPTLIKSNNWGKVPFVELSNNDFKENDLKNIKPLIDSYDLIESESINQIADIREVLIKVMGYSGSTAAEILEGFRANGVVKIDDQNGQIDVIKTEIPTEARTVQLKRLEKNIYKIGMGVDLSIDNFGGQTSGIALKFLYENLNLKSNIAIRKLQKSLYEFSWFITDDYNRKYEKNVDFEDIKYTITKAMLVNDAELINSLRLSKGIISDKTITERHPYAENDENERLKEEEQESYGALDERFNKMNEFRTSLVEESVKDDEKGDK